MNLSKEEIRKAIHGNNILWRCSFIDELVTHPNYDLIYTFGVDVNFMSCAQRINILTGNLDQELATIEEFYSKRNRPSNIYLDPSTYPTNLADALKTKGYVEDPKCEEIWWVYEINNRELSVDINKDIKILECTTRELFEDHLKAAMEGYVDFKFWASLLSKSYRTALDGVTVKHFVAYLNDRPVACSSLGIYFDHAYLINTAVVPEFRRKKIHTTMMVHRINYVKDFGVKKVFYQTDYDNDASIATGKKVGFEEAFRRNLYTKQ